MEILHYTICIEIALKSILLLVDFESTLKLLVTVTKENSILLLATHKLLITTHDQFEAVISFKQLRLQNASTTEPSETSMKSSEVRLYFTRILYMSV